MRRFVFAACVVLAACPGPASPRGSTEGLCAEHCKVKVKYCDERHCSRGCLFVLDRLVENQEDQVLACMAATPRESCDDVAWAECAARIGPHIDGGPPPPRPVDDTIEE